MWKKYHKKNSVRRSSLEVCPLLGLSTGNQKIIDKLLKAFLSWKNSAHGEKKFLVTLNCLKLMFTTNFGTYERDSQIHSSQDKQHSHKEEQGRNYIVYFFS